MLPAADTPLTFDTLSELLRVDEATDAWTATMTAWLQDHRDAGVELHPVHERGHVLCDRGLPLHNLFCRAMADNIGDAWPHVLAWIASEPGLDGRDHENLVNLWRGFWVDLDPLGTDELLQGTPRDVQRAIDHFNTSIELLASLGVDHPKDSAPADWNDAITKSPVGRVAGVAHERVALLEVLEGMPRADSFARSPSPTEARRRL